METLVDFLAAAREGIGNEIPLATDHFGPFGVEDVERVLSRIERFGLAWFEDPVPWQFTELYARLSRGSSVPLCTGEDIFLEEGFRPLLEANAVSLIHPDVLTAGGLMETKRIGDAAARRGIGMVLHMAESPIGCMAAVHAAAASESFIALEYHSADVPWWDDLVTGLPRPLVRDGFITVPDAPGLGIESLVDEVIEEHLDPASDGLWLPTERWDGEWSHDRPWS